MTDKVTLYDPQGQGKRIGGRRHRDESMATRPPRPSRSRPSWAMRSTTFPACPALAKTAAKLIKQYGSVEELVKHSQELSPKMRENVWRRPSYSHLAQLVTLRCDVPSNLDLEKCRFRGVNCDALRKHLIELGFTNLLKRVGGVPEAPIPEPVKCKPEEDFSTDLFGDANEPAARSRRQESSPDPKTHCADCNYRLVNTAEQFEQFSPNWRNKPNSPSTPRPMPSARVQQHRRHELLLEEGTGYYLPVAGPAGGEVLPLQPDPRRAQADPRKPRHRQVGHNLKYDPLVMRKRRPHARPQDGFHDRRLPARRQPRPYGIDRLAAQVFGIRKIPSGTDQYRPAPDLHRRRSASIVSPATPVRTRISACGSAKLRRAIHPSTADRQAAR